MPTKPFERYNGNLDEAIQTAKAASGPPKKKRKKTKAQPTQKEEGAAGGVSPQSCSNVPNDVVAEAWTLRRLWRRGGKACCMGQGCRRPIGKGVHRPNAAWL